MIPPIDPTAHDRPVPRILHQVWVGGPIPEREQRNWEIWEQALPANWSIEHWTSERLQQEAPFEALVPRLHAQGVSWRGTADVVRLWAVALHGGVYMDSDAYPAAPDLSSLAGDTAWVADRPGRIPTGTLCNGAFGMPARHPFVADVAARAEEQLARGIRDDHHIAGPRSFRFVYDRSFPRPRLRRDFGVGARGHLRDVRKRGASYDQQLAAEQNPGMVVIHP